MSNTAAPVVARFARTRGFAAALIPDRHGDHVAPTGDRFRMVRGSQFIGDGHGDQSMAALLLRFGWDLAQHTAELANIGIVEAKF